MCSLKNDNCLFIEESSTLSLSLSRGLKAAYLSIELSRAMGKVRINNFLCKETTKLKEVEAEVNTTWVEAESDDYKTVEAEVVDFKNLEAEAEAEVVGF